MEVLGNYIGGKFVLPSSPDSELAPQCPADLGQQPTRFPVATAAVDEAVASARATRRLWADTPVEHRIAAVQRIKLELQRREPLLTAAITQEIGKPLWEAATEVKSMVAKVDVTVNEGMKLIGGFSPQGLNGECRFRPHGVMAVIGPFNFPGHLPNGHIIPALAAGNTVVFKPSEVAPAVGQLYAEAVHAAQLPSGVFNMVQGSRAVGERLTTIDGVDGVLFTGSQSVGAHIQKANANHPGKILALELGGKNCSLVLEDAQLDKALYDVLFSAYVTAGQRCSATSRAIVHASLVDQFIERLTALVGRLRVGNPKAPDTFMGPLATAAGLEKFLTGCARAKDEGAEVILQPGLLEMEPRGYYARPGLHRIREVKDDSAYQRDELFGPRSGHLHRPGSRPRHRAGQLRGLRPDGGGLHHRQLQVRSRADSIDAG